MEEAKKNNTLIRLGVISLVLFLVVFSSLRVYRAIKLDNSEYVYNGATGNFAFEVVETNGLRQHIVTVYTFEDDKKEHEKVIPLQFGPKEMDDIVVEKDIDNLLLMGSKEDSLRDMIYITQDPLLIGESKRDSLVASLEIMKVVGNYTFGVYKIPINLAYTYDNKNVEQKLPIVTCDDVLSNRAIVLIKKGNSNRIYSDKGCVILEAVSNKDLIRVADRLILDLLGVF
ncbi:hypothetical protein J4455_04270 [Candidatus Woesearchaeota archaeon]|nr:hypothetical protein [Candidatus Woesearchaeota archaeon]